MSPRALLAAVLVCGAACRSSKAVVERLDVDAPSLVQDSSLGWTQQALDARAKAQLVDSGAFVWAKPDEKAEETWRVRIQLDVFGPDDEGNTSPEPAAEVWGALMLKRRQQGTVHEAKAHQVSPVKGLGLEETHDAVRLAVDLVLKDLSNWGGLLLKGSKKKDAELEVDLKSEDTRTRWVAAQLLAEHHDPAATPVLLKMLESDDLDQVRLAMGALVELKEARAVPVLIDVARAKGDVFQREVVFTLGAIGGEDAEAYLYTVAQGHDQQLIRASAQQALDEISARKKEQAK